MQQTFCNKTTPASGTDRQAHKEELLKLFCRCVTRPILTNITEGKCEGNFSYTSHELKESSVKYRQFIPQLKEFSYNLASSTNVTSMVGSYPSVRKFFTKLFLVPFSWYKWAKSQFHQFQCSSFYFLFLKTGIMVHW